MERVGARPRGAYQGRGALTCLRSTPRPRCTLGLMVHTMSVVHACLRCSLGLMVHAASMVHACLRSTPRPRCTRVGRRGRRCRGCSRPSPTLSEQDVRWAEPLQTGPSAAALCPDFDFHAS